MDGQQQFAQDVLEGLSSQPKHLSSKYFYDAAGDALFQQIMKLPEYYLTSAELEIFTEQSPEIIKSINEKQELLQVVELGAGDGYKTKIFLAALQEMQYEFTYNPIDISGNVLQLLKENILASLPQTKITTIQGDYFTALAQLNHSGNRKLILFLGSSLGNMTDKVSAAFIKELAARMERGDMLLLGLDMIKDESIVLPAYNDTTGVTKDFNLNLLQRMNRELGADFKIDQFSHLPTYTREEGVAKSALVSNISQQVYVSALDKTFSFAAGEPINTEISRKYNDEILQQILGESGLHLKGKFTDVKLYFTDYLLQKL